MYTLGALPTFPSSFPYRDYIYIADLNICLLYTSDAADD